MVRTSIVTPGLQTMTPTTPKDQGTDERFILVCGQPGVGKSSFINAVSNSTLRIGSGLASSTEKVEISLPFFVEGQCFRLVDTPGYDEDSGKSDTDVLNAIASFLASEYTNGRQLAGAIYIHSIASSRMGGTGRRNLNMFQKMCGRRALRNVAVVTTRWDQVKMSSGVARETELRTKSTSFKHLFENGAALFRYDKNQDIKPAQNVMRYFSATTSIPLLVQREMVDDGKLISDTTVGIELQKDFRKRMEESHTTMRQLKEEFADFKKENKIPAARDVRKEMIAVKEKFDRTREDCRKLIAIKTAPQALRILISPTVNNPPAAASTSMTTAAAAAVAAPSAAPEQPQASGSGNRSRSNSRSRSRVHSLSSIPALPPQQSTRPHSRRNSFGSIPALPPSGPITSTPLNNKGKGREVLPDPQPQVTFTRPREPSFSRHARQDSGRRTRDVATRQSSRHRDSRRKSRGGAQDQWDEIRFFLFVGLLLVVLVPMIQRTRSITAY